MGEYFQRSSNFVIGFFVHIATIYAKSEIIIFIQRCVGKNDYNEGTVPYN